jgi:hypothetical protein
VHKLDLEGCTNLTVIRDMSTVSILDISFCDNIREVLNLPKAIKVTANGCSNLRVLSKLPKLQSLYALDCTSLTEISYTFDDMSTLKLDVCGCEALNEIKGNKMSIRIRD